MYVSTALRQDTEDSISIVSKALFSSRFVFSWAVYLAAFLFNAVFIVLAKDLSLEDAATIKFAKPCSVSFYDCDDSVLLTAIESILIVTDNYIAYYDDSKLRNVI